MNDESEIDWQKDCWRGANGSRIWALSRGVHNLSNLVRAIFGPFLNHSWTNFRAKWTVDPWLRVSSFLLSARILKRIRRNIARVSFSFKHGFIILNRFVCRIFSWREIKIFSSSKPRCWRFQKDFFDIGTTRPTLCLWIKSNVWFVFPTTGYAPFLSIKEFLINL